MLSKIKFNILQSRPNLQKVEYPNKGSAKELQKDTVELSRKVSFQGYAKHCIEIAGLATKAKVFLDNLDYQSYRQIKACCDHPAFQDSPIRIMPDVHSSKSSVVGFSAPMTSEKGFIPGIIGSDIGCGVLCTKIDTKSRPVDFKKLDEVIRTYISGKNHKSLAGVSTGSYEFRQKLEELCSKVFKRKQDEFTSQFCTLGGGNHFIEVNRNGAGEIFLTVHTGSRKLGSSIAHHYEEAAITQNPYRLDKALSFVIGDEAKKYFRDVKTGREFAYLNRQAITETIMNRMGWRPSTTFESVHNYISDDGMVRKGAISAYPNERMIIPLNMRDGSILAIGKGNREWNNTAPHGAGRKFSRSEAAGVLSYDEYEKSMDGIFTTCVKPQTLDESPQAYKDASAIIDGINETVEIQEVIKPVYNFKG